MKVQKSTRDKVRAERASLKRLLDRSAGGSRISRLGLQSRLNELDEEIAQYDLEPEPTHVTAELYFGGRPVIGNEGIESEFGALAVSKFQDLVAKVMAHRAGSLGQRGAVPNRNAATLHITNVARGSFGFVLEELRSQTGIFDSDLKQAVDETTHLLDAFTRPNEEDFEAAVGEVDQRVLSTASDLFQHMHGNGATLRLVSGVQDLSFGNNAVQRASDRALLTALDEKPTVLLGKFLGALPSAHQFEMTNALGDTIRGKIDSAVPSATIAEWNRTLVGLEVTVDAKIKRVLKGGNPVREAFTLMSISRSGVGGAPLALTHG